MDQNELKKAILWAEKRARRWERNAEKYGVDAYQKMAGRYRIAAGCMWAVLEELDRWIPVAERLPDEYQGVLCIVDGQPAENITLKGAYQIGEWDGCGGWIIEEWPEWEDAKVSWWRPLPGPPERGDGAENRLGYDACVYCAHCCRDGAPVYRSGEEDGEFCTLCDSDYCNFEWRGMRADGAWD